MTDFAERVAAAKAATESKSDTSFADRVAKAKELYEKPAAPTFDDDLIPTLAPGGGRTPEDDEIDALIGGTDIIEAYRRYIGKMEPKIGKRRESIMISCPMPGHTDKNPSAWANIDKGTWFCAVCERGGDQYDLAAIKYGYDLDSYKRDGSFPQLRRDMASELGYVVRKTLGGQEYLERTAEPEPEPQPKPTAEQPPKTAEEPPKTAATEPDGYGYAAPLAENEQSDRLTGIIDWRSLLPETTFLRDWMETTHHDDLPDEFYFWLGFLAVGFAAGNDVLLSDQPEVKANLFVCLLGPTGIGKTRAIGTLIRVLREALPYDPDSATSTGTNIIPTPGSAESLIDAFSKPEYDPTDPKKITAYRGVRGLLRFDEFSSLAGRAARSGSVMKPTLMEFFDSYHAIDLKSRGAGYVRAEDHFCSTITTTQPRAVREIMEQADADSGFINRWVFVLGRDKKLQAIREKKVEIDHLIEPLQQLRTWARALSEPRILRFNSEAREVWEEFFEKTIEPIRKSDNMPLLTRLDLILKKIILILSINETKTIVDADVVRRAISLFEYLSLTYTAISSQMQWAPFEDDRLTVRRIVLDYEKKNGKGITMRDIRRHVGPQVAGDNLVRVVRVMVDIGELNETTVKPEGRGRVTTRYTYVK